MWQSLVIGFIVAEGSRNPLVFVVGVFLSNFPEALASAATMKVRQPSTLKPKPHNLDPELGTLNPNP